MKYYKVVFNYEKLSAKPLRNTESIAKYFESMDSQSKQQLTDWFYKNMNYDGNTIVGNPTLSEISKTDFDNLKPQEKINL